MFPIADDVPGRYPPVATWALIAINATLFALELSLPEPWREYLLHRFGVVPARFTDSAWAMSAGFPADGLMPLITCQFFHADWMHLIFNLWTLWIFGDNVEDRLGPTRFVAFYLFCGVVAAGVDIASRPTSTVPTIGASGAISGVLGAYLLLFPRARILLLIPIFFFPLIIPVYAVLYLVAWLGIQLVSGVATLVDPGNGDNVAWWAHVGGFVAGITLVLPLLPRRRIRPLYADEYGREGLRLRPAGTGRWMRGRRWS